MTNTNKITARIRQAESDKGTDALWLFIDRIPNRKTNVDDLKDILGIKDRPDDEGNVAYAVLEGELVAIRSAINEYLEGEK